jgi:hypothetical protein
MKSMPGVRPKLVLLWIVAALAVGSACWTAHAMLVHSSSPDMPQATPAVDKSAQAEKLFGAMEKKILAAKSLKWSCEITAGDGSHLAATATC